MSKIGADIIQKHRTWDIIDSSKLQTFMSCPRKYYYKYMLGWSYPAPNKHLVFGEGWHRAMKILYTEGMTDPDVYSKAFDAFLSYYRQYFDTEYDEVNAPKEPAGAAQGLAEYIQEYKDIDRDYDVIYAETAGTVIVGEGRDKKPRMLNFRVDTIVEGERGYECLEHKTGSVLTDKWDLQWELKVQPSSYYHVLMCMFEPESVYGVRMNGTFFYKTMRKFHRYLIRKAPDILQAWMDMINYYWDQIDWSTEVMMETPIDAYVMRAFPMNTQACMDYFRKCQFMDFCTAYSNPLRVSGEVPADMVEERWDPSESQKEADNVVQLT